MATGVTTLTGFNENPYISVAEYKDAPTSIDYDNLVVGGNANAQDAELARVILRATSYLNEYLNQDLVASLTTETQRVRLNTQGFIALHPDINPILSLNAFNYGPTPNNLVALPDPSVCWFENQQVIIPLSQVALTYSSQGPLSFGGGAPGQPIYVQYTYVGGYVNTRTTANASIGATSITVADASGIIAGQVYRIIDGAFSETVTISSSYVYGSTTVTLASALVSAHTAGATLSNLPFVIKEATILMTTVFLKVRGDNSMTMSITTAPTANIPGGMRYGNEVQMALDMVSKYRRIR
jgi:hypothetical protein